jgi:threonine/homoserine/homoserine lactone efflux protein
VIGIITLFGACYLIYLGMENLRILTGELEVKLDGKDALKRGIIANFLSPSPYLFWLSIGGPMVFKSLEISALAAILFVIGFYSLLIGSKIGFALIVDKSKSLIKSRYYVYIIRILGLTLILFALFFVYEGLSLIGLF